MGTLRPLAQSAELEPVFTKPACISSIHSNYSMLQEKRYLFSESILFLRAAKISNIDKVIYIHDEKYLYTCAFFTRSLHNGIMVAGGLAGEFKRLEHGLKNDVNLSKRQIRAAVNNLIGLSRGRMIRMVVHQ